MKKIVTHITPDLDAIASIWLIKRFLPEWGRADLVFVPAGTTLDNKPADEDREIIHVDTGLGRFDHHQTSKKTCATERVFNYLKDKNYIKKHLITPIDRMVNIVNSMDHFQEVFLPDADDDIYDFLVVSALDGLKTHLQDDKKLVEMGRTILDGILITFRNKVQAEKEIKRGQVFQTVWGKALALNSQNEETMRLALKKGYSLVIRKSPHTEHLRIKSRPVRSINLKKLYQKLKQEDESATWFFHSSGHMLLNGSSKNPKTVPTKLKLKQVVDIIKEIE